MIPFAADEKTFEETRRQSAKSFLTGGVPDLKFQLDPFDIDHFYFEIHRDGCEVVDAELSLVEPLKNAGFSDTWFPNYHNFSHVVIRFVFHF